MLDEDALATFTDRHTIVYERWYPHEIDLVWEAVSTGEHLDVWLLPESRVERRLGGACAFGWGGPVDGDNGEQGTVTVFDPPTAIEFTMRDSSWMRFDLAERDGGTHLRYTLHFLPAPGGNVEEPHPGGDLPAGPDSAWRPGFLAGFHTFLGDLRGFLSGAFTSEDRAASLVDPEPEAELTERYRVYVREHCPPA